MHRAECPRLRGEGWYTSRTITRSGKRWWVVCVYWKGNYSLIFLFATPKRAFIFHLFSRLTCYGSLLPVTACFYSTQQHAKTRKSRCHYFNNFSTVVELRRINFSYTVNLLWHDLKFFTPLYLFHIAGKENWLGLLGEYKLDTPGIWTRKQGDRGVFLDVVLSRSKNFVANSTVVAQ